MALQRSRQGVEPVRRSEEVFQGFLGKHVLDAKRDQHGFGINGQLHFSPDLRRVVGVTAEHQNHDARGPDGIDNGRAPFLTWYHIAWRNPAADSFRF